MNYGSVDMGWKVGFVLFVCAVLSSFVSGDQVCVSGGWWSLCEPMAYVLVFIAFGVYYINAFNSTVMYKNVGKIMHKDSAFSQL